MPTELDTIIEHDISDDCPVCRAQDLIEAALLPAVNAWETAGELPRFTLALHGAAGLLGMMLEEGIARDEVETALGRLLDEIEIQIARSRAMGGPPQGSA